MTRPRNNRIVHVPRRFVAEEWGGTETVILEISRQQQRAGGRPEIITSMALAKRREEQIGGVPVTVVTVPPPAGAAHVTPDPIAVANWPAEHVPGVT